MDGLTDLTSFSFKLLHFQPMLYSTIELPPWELCSGGHICVYPIGVLWAAI
jgi:hypothetical protein